MQKLSAQKAGYHQSQMDFMDSILDALMTQRLSHFTVAIDGADALNVALTPETFNADVATVATDFYSPIVVSWKGKVYHFDLTNIVADQACQTVLPDTVAIPVPSTSGVVNEMKVVVYALLQEANREIVGLHFGVGEVATEGNAVLPELVTEVSGEGVVPVGIITIKVPDTASADFEGGTSELDNADYEVIYEDISGLYPRFAVEQ